ncbi:MAG: winged helix-turn-helix transcriptional regulator [Candidatus Methanomethyliaceae archaeon]|nr:winged helix-turn-helix transcriptional regulator [Candidatus Methanomethyliaceae archaeon]
MGVLRLQNKGSVVDRLRKYIKSTVEVHLLDGQVIKGKLVQVDEDLMNIFLEDCVDIDGRPSPATVIMGGSISHVSILSLPAEDSLEDKVFQLILNNKDISITEIAKILNTKPSSVRSAILRLKKKGLISTNESKRTSPEQK